MSIRRSLPYTALAASVARAAGLEIPEPGPGNADPAAAACAEDAGLRAQRDAVWIEYERRLADVRTYGLRDVQDWLEKEHGVKISIMTVQRDRAAVLGELERVRWAAGKARAVMQAAAGSGESDLVRAAGLRANQIIFEALMDLDSAALEGLEPAHIIRLLEAQAKVSRSFVAQELDTARTAEMRRRFDEQLDAAKARAAAGDGRLGPEQIAEIRRAVFGEGA